MVFETSLCRHFYSLLHAHCIPTGITVAIAGSKVITLPTDSTHLFSSAWPELPSVQYEWELLRGPHGGTLSGRNQKDIILSNVSR